MEILLQPSKETLLAQLEKKHIPVETHCRSGICGMCKKRLLKGEVTYLEEPLAYLAEGEVLGCCASAATEVSIEHQN